jgi:electron transfer flavoprotein alpha subunit
MASIVAYIEVREGAISPSSLFAIGESRRIAEAAGATVYGFLALGPVEQAHIDRLAEQASAAGADRVLCSSNVALAGPPLDITHGPVLGQLADHLRPMLFLFPAGGAGVELGPPLAIRIGAAYVPGATVDIRCLDTGSTAMTRRILVTRWRAAGDAARRIDVGDLERPVVAVLTAGSGSGYVGESCAEVETIPCPAPRHPDVRILGTENDPSAAVESCSTLVCVSAATEPAELEQLREALPSLACLRAEDACDLGLASPQNLFLLSVDSSGVPVRARVLSQVSGTAAELAAALLRARSSGKEAST